MPTNLKYGLRNNRSVASQACCSNLHAVDFFCGAGGMSYGLAKAKISVVAGIDSDPLCEETYSFNNKKSKYINLPIEDLKPSRLADDLGIHKNCDNLVLVGCSPCQFWSKIKTNKKKSEGSAYLLLEFLEFIKYFNPGWIVVENVPGIVSKKGSVLPSFTKSLESLGYSLEWDILDLSRYGIPQTRHRFVLLASRLIPSVTLPRETHECPRVVADFIGEENGFYSIEAGCVDESVFMHTASSLSEINLKRMKATPKNGGMRKNYRNKEELHIDSFVSNPNNFADVYARMSWDKPAPTITTRFNSFSNGRFGHPEENRAISLREGAVLQTFPVKYRFFGSLQGIAKQIGNAVPPRMSEIIGKHLVALHQRAKI